MGEVTIGPRRGIAMIVLVSGWPRKDHRDDHGRRLSPWIGLRVSTAAAVATAMLGSAVLLGPSRSVQAGDEGKSSTAPAQAAHRAFVREIRRTLKADDDRLITLAKQVADEPDSPASLPDQLGRARIDVARARGDYLNAKLTREVAEIAARSTRKASSFRIWRRSKAR
jgi:hypothetical protein